MGYDIYLFDADNTLFDYDKGEENALGRMFARYGFKYGGEVRGKYRDINNSLWEQFEKNAVTLEKLGAERFRRLLREIGEKADAEAFSAEYLTELGKAGELTEGAVETCGELYGRGKKLYIVTNGISATQRARLEASRIRGYISDIFVSQDIGRRKPELEFFEHVFARMASYNNGAPVKKEKILIIGDSPGADILGGQKAGIDTCWFNPAGKSYPLEAPPAYTISALTQVLTLRSNGEDQ